MNSSNPDPLLNIRRAIVELEHRVEGIEGALRTENLSRRTFVLEEGQVRRVIVGRRIRDQHLGADLCSDPAFDLLLEALAADLAGRRFTVCQLRGATTVPVTTALRWIKKLESHGWLQVHPAGDEIQWVELTPQGSVRMRSLFDALGPACLLV